MSPVRRAVRQPNVLLNHRSDRTTAFLPWRGARQTSTRSAGAVDCVVSLKFGVFVALPVTAVVLIRGGDPAAAGGVLAAVTGLAVAADRSYLTLRWTRAS